MKYFRKISVLIYVATAFCLMLVGVNQAYAALSYGSEAIHSTSNIYEHDVAGLTNNKFVVAYKKGSGGPGAARIGSISGTTISYPSSENEFDSGDVNQIQVERLTDTSFVIIYQDASNSNYGTAIIGTISGTTISYGSEYVYNSASSSHMHVARLSDTKFIISYLDVSSLNGYAIVGNVSGSTITYGSAQVFASTTNGAYENAISALVQDSSPYKFVISYRYNDGTIDGKSIIGSVTGSTVSFTGSAYNFNTGTPGNIENTRLENDKFAISYSDSANSNYGYSVIGDVSGTTISHGSEYLFNGGRSGFIDITSLNEYTINTVYRDDDDGRLGKNITGIISNNVIAYGSETTFDNRADNLSNSYLPASSAEFVIAYRDIDNSNYGTAIFGQEDSPGGPAVPEFSSIAVQIFSALAGLMVVIFIGIYIKKKIIDPKKREKK